MHAPHPCINIDHDPISKFLTGQFGRVHDYCPSGGGTRPTMWYMFPGARGSVLPVSRGVAAAAAAFWVHMLSLNALLSPCRVTGWTQAPAPTRERNTDAERDCSRVDCGKCLRGLWRFHSESRHRTVSRL